MAEIWTMGETLVEIMRTEVDKPLNETALFSGPYPSGSSAIMISTVARMGHSCGIISGVGKDGFGECMVNRLKKDGVDVSKVLIDPNGSTACAFVAYDHDGDRRYLFHWDETPATKAVMPDVTEPSLKEAKYFHVMGCALTAKLSYGWEIVKTAKAMKAQGTKISFDPNVRVEHLTNPEKSKESYEIIHAILEITSLFAPGLDELKLLTGIDDVEEAVKKCFENPNLEILMLKQGSKGSKIYTRDGQVIEQGLFKVEAVDPTGAGDTSVGAFLCALLEGKELAECAEIAAAAGALNVAAFGPMEGKISPENVQAMREGKFQF
ncbi:MAG: sugar kinase [Lachnospiraceae bacterium]|uniref:sugar kinase n=1 Tax=Candidatus Merdisoma sp. JLR.KK006 TaxID=3112626 RepID=UPI002FF42787|nr:sugar kinase [Lachnospiraceae bacterium]